MNIWFGGPALDRDGKPVGNVHRVLVEPEDREVTHVIIRGPIRGPIRGSVIVPLDLVQGSRDDSLLLHLSADDLRNLPLYHEGEGEANPAEAVDVESVCEPAERHPQLVRALDVEPNNVELKDTTCVTGLGRGDEQASLLGLLLDTYTNQITGLIAAKPVGQAEGIELPAHWIDTLTADEIHITPRPERPEEGLGAWQTEY